MLGSLLLSPVNGLTFILREIAQAVESNPLLDWADSNDSSTADDGGGSTGADAPAERTDTGDAFEVPAESRAEITGRRLVLIDDVLTSGATLDACARALLRARAAHVDVLVFARVVAPARAPI